MRALTDWMESSVSLTTYTNLRNIGCWPRWESSELANQIQGTHPAPKNKCEFKTAALDFLGHCVTNKGLKPDQKKVESILQMPNPTDVEAVRLLQWMIMFLAKFLPRLSSVMEPIRRLTRQYCEWRMGAGTRYVDGGAEETRDTNSTSNILRSVQGTCYAMWCFEHGSRFYADAGG